MKNHICNRFYGISCEGPVLMEQVLKNADISILRQFLANFFSISINFTKYCLHAKFQINWTIQTEITEGRHTNLLLSSTEPHVLAGSNQAPEERGSASNHTLYQ